MVPYAASCTVHGSVSSTKARGGVAGRMSGAASDWSGVALRANSAHPAAPRIAVASAAAMDRPRHGGRAASTGRGSRTGCAGAQRSRTTPSSDAPRASSASRAAASRDPVSGTPSGATSTMASGSADRRSRSSAFKNTSSNASCERNPACSFRQRSLPSTASRAVASPVGMKKTPSISRAASLRSVFRAITSAIPPPVGTASSSCSTGVPNWRSTSATLRPVDAAARAKSQAASAIQRSGPTSGTRATRCWPCTSAGTSWASRVRGRERGGPEGRRVIARAGKSSRVARACGRSLPPPRVWNTVPGPPGSPRRAGRESARVRRDRRARAAAPSRWTR